MLAARTWQRKYTPDDGDLVRLFCVPALEDAHSESVELWSPGNPLFQAPEFVAEAKDDDFPQGTTLKELLEGTGGRRDS